MQGDDALKIPQIPTPTKLRVFEFLDTQKYLLSSTSLATLQKKKCSGLVIIFLIIIISFPVVLQPEHVTFWHR